MNQVSIVCRWGSRSASREEAVDLLWPILCCVAELHPNLKTQVLKTGVLHEWSAGALSERLDVNRRDDGTVMEELGVSTIIAGGGMVFMAAVGGTVDRPPNHCVVRIPAHLATHSKSSVERIFQLMMVRCVPSTALVTSTHLRRTLAQVENCADKRGWLLYDHSAGTSELRPFSALFEV